MRVSTHDCTAVPKTSLHDLFLEMNLIIRVNLLVVFLLDALLDVPEWGFSGFDPDSFCCLEWSWVLRVLWDMVLYPWCGLVGFFPTSNRWFIFAVPENNIGLQVESGLYHFNFQNNHGSFTKDVSTFFQFFDTSLPLVSSFLFLFVSKMQSSPHQIAYIFYRQPLNIFDWVVTWLF